jgi:type IV pilus assembly protein PilM
VPGNLGLSKFIKLPPIESKKIPDIVKYEARQQIPFPLEQVVWRWQRLAGGTLDGGSSLGGVHEPFDRVDDRQEHR